MFRSLGPLRWLFGGVLAALGVLCGLCGPVLRPAQAQVPVDVELVLAVDVSLSMSHGELEIQRQGYVAALTDERVVRAMLDGLHGRIAVTYFEWAGARSHRIVVPWTVIESREDAEAVAAELTADPPESARRTSISGALRFAGDLFAESGFRGARRIVDVSGDGPNNHGDPVPGAREMLISRGITINGLPLMTNSGVTSSFDVDDLDVYYRECVIGGPGAFMIPVNDWAQFPEAVRRKLVIELAGEPAPSTSGRDAFPLIRAQTNSYDCLIGEKMWQDRSWIWRDP